MLLEKGKAIIFFNEKQQIGQEEAYWNGFELDYAPHISESAANIGCYLCIFAKKNPFYGRFVVGFHFGKFLIEFSLKKPISFHNDYLSWAILDEEENFNYLGESE